MLGTGEALGERQRLSVDDVDRHEPVGQLERRLDRVREPVAQVVLHHEPVDDHLDRVLQLLVELDLLVEVALLPVDLHAREPLAAELLEQVLVLALPVADDRRVDGELRPLGQAQHLVDDRLDGLARDRPPADRAVRPPGARVQEPKVVVDLRDRADGGARVSRGGLLVDRDRRREPVDRVDVGLLHHLQELARVGRERLDVPPLPLGVDRVEGERGLPGPGEPGDGDQRVPRQADGDVLQIVLAGAVNDELFLGHQVSLALRPDRTDVRVPFPQGRSAAPVPAAAPNACASLPSSSPILRAEGSSTGGKSSRTRPRSGRIGGARRAVRRP